jgi:hypothetical protein
VSGVQINNLKFNWSREGCGCSGDAFGRAMEMGVSLTGTPVDSENVPITGNLVDCYADPTFGALGTTRLTRQFTGDFEVPGHFGMIWPLDSTLTSYAGTPEMAMEAKFIAKIGADGSQEVARLTQARAGTKIFIRNILKGAQIEAGPPISLYTFQIDVCAEVSNISEQGDQDGIMSYDFTFTPVQDPGWGKPWEITVINKLAAL